MPCSFKAAASLVVYSNGTTRLSSLSKFWPSSVIQSLSTSSCICTACALVKFVPIPRLLTRYLRAGPKKVAVSGADLPDSTISESSTFYRPSIIRSFYARGYSGTQEAVLRGLHTYPQGPSRGRGSKLCGFKGLLSVFE